MNSKESKIVEYELWDDPNAPNEPLQVEILVWEVGSVQPVVGALEYRSDCRDGDVWEGWG